MSLSTSALASSLLAMQADAARQSFATAMVKQGAQADASVVALVEQALETAQSAPPPPAGQGIHLDVMA